EVGCTLVGRVGGDVHPAEPGAVGAPRFPHARVDVPRGHDRHRQQAAAGAFLQLGGEVVVDLDAGGEECGVGGRVGHALAAQSEVVREHDLDPDARGVHHREARVDVVGTDVD